ncbi:MAG TPA: hypothetical protein VMT22_05355 [Terriglobales bacterium]|jgi:VIT1/CCC1 family predicted Fe2+/Mn2+ transporter|nr:hypothetical protein [Terriglobales bacterium]
MSIEEVLYWYAGLFCVLMVPLIWLLIKRKREKSAAIDKAGDSRAQSKRQPFDRSFLSTLRPQAILSGEMWLKTLLAAFIALCVGVIIVVYVFPLGAAWAASAAFVAVIVIVGLAFALLD